MKDEDEMFIDKEDNLMRTVAGFLLIFVAVCVVAAFCLCAGGCATTTRIGTDPGSVRQSSAYVFGRLEESVEGFDRGIEDAIRRSRQIEDDIERIEFLFNEYEREALRLRDEVNKIRREKQAIGENAQ